MQVDGQEQERPLQWLYHIIITTTTTAITTTTTRTERNKIITKGRPGQLVNWLRVLARTARHSHSHHFGKSTLKVIIVITSRIASSERIGRNKKENATQQSAIVKDEANILAKPICHSMSQSPHSTKRKTDIE